MMGRSEGTTILAGDIGGTKTNLGLFTSTGDRPEPIIMESYPSRLAGGIEELVEQFLELHPETIESACFGIAGPVINGRCKLTNLPWEVSEAAIKKCFGWESVSLINDLTATGLAVGLLRPDELEIINDAPVDPMGTVGLVAPGTGLGMALLVPKDGKLVPLPSEGGHVDFAARNEKEVELWKYLRRRHVHVSVERIVSGPGLFLIYSWLKDGKYFDESPQLAERMKLVAPPMVITEAAISDKDPLCVETLDIFVSILGAHSGNLALTGMTNGGIYLGGGIPPKILPKLRDGRFMEAFVHKGRFEKLLSSIAVYVILNDKAGLLGAAKCAFGMSKT